MPICAQQATPNYLEQTTDGINTLQSWYTESSGLYQTTGWWNSANAITVLANYSKVSHSDKYVPVFANTLTQAQNTSAGFINNYYDDEGWWALAWIDAYDLTKGTQYLSMAESIFSDMAGGWDSTCNGGIWWSKDKTYKNAIANELFLSVAAHLARRVAPNQRIQYLIWAQKEWSWFKNSGMINSENLINDGLNLSTCQNNQQNTWTYNQGVILGGLTELNKIAPNPSLPATAQAIASATLTHLTDANGVLHDTCEPNCGADGVQFKGIFVRNLMALNDAFPNLQYKKFTDTNAESIWNNSQGPNFEFGQVWSGPFDAGNAGSQSSALDAFVAAAEMQEH
jgi:predicted alpha-1,6-mannanase (GH76 family)